MSAGASSILRQLHSVAVERARRESSPDLAARATALKAYQQKRFARIYADLLATSLYGPAAGFFLEELYGPRDFTERDAQFVRVVPALVRLFPHDIVATVDTLAELHALSEMLDSETASHLASSDVDALAYTLAWQATGRAESRERQIALTIAVGESLDRLTRNAFVRNTLRLMRGPAQAAGLGELQRFLETGFDTFKAMHGAHAFLSTVGQRERELARSLFAASTDSADGARHLGDIALGQLP